MKKLQAYLASALAVLFLISCSGGSSNEQAEQQPVNVKLIAINDFHGRLKVDPNDSGAKVTIVDQSTGLPTSLYAGGAAYLATLVKQLRATTEHSMVIAAGDVIGASQPIAGLTSEEAAIDVMSEIGLEVTSVGNHEFDKGKDELLRMQSGGCKPTASGGVEGINTCITNSQSRADGKFGGAKFKYLAANVTDTKTGQPILPSTFTKKFGAATIGFVGLTLKDTPNSTSGAKGLSFVEEIPVINQKADELKRNGADAVIVLIHQGGKYNQANYINYQPQDSIYQCGRGTAGYNGFESLGPIVEGLKNVDIVVSGHTHEEYVCPNFRGTGVLVTSAGFYGRLVSDINLKIVPGKGVIEKTANTIPVINEVNAKNSIAIPKGYRALTADAATQKIIETYDNVSKGPLHELQGYTREKLSNCGRKLPSWEAPVGNIVADAQLDSYNTAYPDAPADVSFTNVGGLRDTIQFVAPDGQVTYEALYIVQPFGNELVYKMMTGSELTRLLEQQWEQPICDAAKKIALPTGEICGRLLQPSRTLTYTWDYNKVQGKPTGEGNLLVPGSVKINGVAIDPAKSYRVVTSKFLAEGNDGFEVFKEGTPFVNWGGMDFTALQEYFKKSSKSSPIVKPTPRVTCLNCPAGIDAFMNDPINGVCVKY